MQPIGVFLALVRAVGSDDSSVPTVAVETASTPPG